MKSSPADAAAWFHRAVLAHQAGRLPEAVDAYDRTIRLAPRHFAAYGNRGVALLDMGRFREALDSFDRASALKGDDALTHNNRGNALRSLKRPQEALASYDRALALMADQPLFHLNRGNALSDLQRYAEALASFDAALALKADLVMAHNNRGNALRSLDRVDEALECYVKAFTLAPGYAEAHYNWANAAGELGRDEAVLAAYDKAIAINPRLYDAHCNRGNVLRRLKRFRDAFASYERAIAIDPARGEAYVNRANGHRDTGWLDLAIADYDRGINADPALFEAYEQRASVLVQLGRFEEAVASIDLTRDSPSVHGRTRGMHLYCQMMLCDWSGWNDAVAELRGLVERGVPAADPFFPLALVDDPALHLSCAKMAVERTYPDKGRACPLPAKAPGDRLRIGYFSADYRWHPMMHVLLEVLETHDRQKFELFAYSLGPDASDDYRNRAVAAFDHFVDVRSLSDREVADHARSHGIDIAVDLMGHTQHSRPGIFAERAAPLQVNYLGYPGTMGAPYVDYIVGDPAIFAASERESYSEKIVYLPDTYLPNGRFKPQPGRGATRAAYGLPETGFVFACFNNAYKITPQIFDVWMRILASAEGSVLWISTDRPKARENLAAEARRRGIDPARLVFASPVPLLDDHLDRLRLADIFLDTLPYNAHTTASDFLRMGVPVLTCPGRSFASRVAAGLLSTVSLPELVAGSLDEYHEIAVGLAQDRARHSALVARLSANLPSSPLFDCERYIRNLERAYAEMQGRVRRGEPAADMRL